MPAHSKQWIDKTTLRVMTYKSGVFTFQLGYDLTQVQPLIERINDAQRRLNKTPALPHIVDKMQNKVMVSSVYSTNTIEGGLYTEQETQDILNKAPSDIVQNNELRVSNLKQAIEWVKAQGKTELHAEAQDFNLSSIFHLHKTVSDKLTEQHNPAGQLRDNQPTQKTIVGNELSGGTYQPPKCLDDIEYLLQAWTEWLNSPSIKQQPSLIRASLAHYYFELIHPFWDGNGRTGRLVEMLVLEQNGYMFSSSSIWSYYNKHLIQYFSLFNYCRKQAKAKIANPNQAFILFMLNGMLETINSLHDEINHLISVLLFNTKLMNDRFSKAITERQYQLVQIIIRNNEVLSRKVLFKSDLVQILYKGKTERTFIRDIDKLKELGFLTENDKGIASTA